MNVIVLFVVALSACAANSGEVSLDAPPATSSCCSLLPDREAADACFVEGLAPGICGEVSCGGTERIAVCSAAKPSTSTTRPIEPAPKR